MDYEKKYNEAMLRADEAVQKGCLDKEMFDIIFPPEDSEDERIRKWLVNYFGSIKETVWNRMSITCEQILAWLEKQKYDRMKPIYDARESFESALEKAWNDYHNGYENVDKLEDDYVECAHAKGFREGYLFGIEKQKESLHVPESCKENPDSFTDVPENAETGTQEQKPVEWSEEDERSGQWILELLADGERKVPEFAEQYRTAFKWPNTRLKSLRPSWKPNEEQMKQLHYALTPGYAFDCDILNGLYEQLKKLM